ncbi:MAG: hypothetical protein ABIB98_02945 [bacterium]
MEERLRELYFSILKILSFWEVTGAEVTITKSEETGEIMFIATVLNPKETQVTVLQITLDLRNYVHPLWQGIGAKWAEQTRQYGEALAKPATINLTGRK